MRLSVSLLALFLLPCVVLAQSPTRHGIELDLKAYPQATPQETLASIIKAIENKRIDYLVAQLADPAFIDERIKRIYGDRFEEQVADTATRLDVGTVRLLKRLAKEGDWKVAANEAHLGAKAVENRSVYMKKVGNRWFLENTQSP